MDAVMYLKEKARMCGSVTVDTCPLRPYVMSCCDCDESTNAEMAVLVVEEWSKAHPIQTRAQKFTEVFGLEFGFNLMNEEWWLAPYEAPKGADK